MEEYLQAALEPAFRNLAFNEHNEIRLFSPGNFYQGMIGAFTAGLIEGRSAVARNISNTQIGHGVNEAHKADELIGHSLALDPKTEAFRLASKLADGTAHKNNYNVGELLRAYVEAGGDTAFMSIPNAEVSTNTQEAVQTTLAETPKVETPETETASGIAGMTPTQIEQSVQEGIRRNAAINPEAMQKTVSDGMSALIAIETRVKAESSNINHPGIGIDSIHYEYMGYLRGEMALDTAAWSMVGAIKTVMQTQTLTEVEAAQLTKVMTEIVGDVWLAEAYVNRTNASMEGLMEEIDRERSVEDNENDIQIGGLLYYKEFTYADEAEKWGIEVFSSWRNELTESEVDSIFRYTEDDYYENINAVLRGVELYFEGGNQKIMEDLSLAMNKASIPEAIRVYRGTSIEALGPSKYLPPAELVGKIITEKAFMSTSMIKDSAFNYKNLILYIDVPAGTKGAFIGNISNLPSEVEVLLNREQDMIIKKAYKDNGQLILIVEIIN